MDPVALQIQTPDSFKTIGSILNTASTAQNLQAGKQQIESQGLGLQKQRQENTERIATQQFMSNPDNWQTNGRIDLDKVNAALPKIAPLTGAATSQKLTELGNAQTGAENAKLAFNNNERTVVGQLYGVMGRAGVDDPKIVGTELDNLANQYPDNKAIQSYIQNAKVGLSAAPAGKGAINKSLITTAQSLMSPDSQNAAFSPQAGTINTGKTIQQVTTQPAVGGNPPSITPGPAVAQNTLSPGSLESIETDAAGAKHVVSRSPQGTILSTRPLGSAPGTQRTSTGGTAGGTPFFNPKPGQMADIDQAQKEVSAVRAQGDAVPQVRNVNAQILKLSRSADSGPGTAKWQNIMGGLSSLWGGTEQVNNYQELGKFLEKNAISNMTAMGGPPSDARLQAAAAANGSTQFNAGALQAVTKFNDATTTAMEKYRQGVDKAVGLAGSDYTKLAAFKSAWAKNMDVAVFRVENAIRDGDQGELQKISRELGPAKMKELAQKRKNLEALAAGK